MNSVDFEKLPRATTSFYQDAEAHSHLITAQHCSLHPLLGNSSSAAPEFLMYIFSKKKFHIQPHGLSRHLPTRPLVGYNCVVCLLWLCSQTSSLPCREQKTHNYR